MSRISRACLAISMLACVAAPARATEAGRFRFESVISLDDMRASILSTLGTSGTRAELRRIFVTEGGGTLVAHPTVPGVEKYIYDINLCHLYVWRWNISADYDPSGALRQVYVNGEPALDGQAAADPLMPAIADDRRGVGVYRMARPRPEASKGESSLGYVLIDADADPDTTGDQMLLGGGPTRADPNDFGKLHAYNVAPWRSIFDTDAARMIMPFEGTCPADPPG